MRSRAPAARIAIVSIALAVAVALFVVFAGGGDETNSARTQAQNTQETTDAPSSPKPRRPRIEAIVVTGGKPVGGVKRLQYERGEHVRFSVRSDVPDEVHVHGFDVKKDVAAGDSVRFAFPADIEGVFEVELEDSKTQIAELRVKP